MEKQITLKGDYNLVDPDKMVKLSSVLRDHIVKQKLFTQIVGKNYAHVEGWQFAGGLMGIFPRIVAVENLSKSDEIKWQAEVEIVDIKTDKIVSRGFAVCSSKEGKRKGADEYAILSMAQTRAIGKAYRNVIGWVMKLSGYEATPAEEMVRTGEVATIPAKAEDMNKAATSEATITKIVVAALDMGFKNKSQILSAANKALKTNVKDLAELNQSQANKFLGGLLRTKASRK